MGIFQAIHRKPFPVLVRRDAQDCGSEQSVEPGVGVPGPAWLSLQFQRAWPVLFSSLTLSRPVHLAYSLSRVLQC